MSKQKSILITPGQRAVIIGQTGSGKTIGAIWQLQNIPLSPVIILDTKGEPSFDRIAAGEDEEIIIFNSAADFIKRWPKQNAEYIIVRPEPLEMKNTEELDDVLMHIYTVGRPALVYIDEAYQWHVNGKAGAGLIGLLTRGRSKRISTIVSTQRPAWISRFCFTESQKVYIYKITDERDRKTIGEFIPGFEDVKPAQKYHFYHYDIDTDTGIVLYNPVPMPKAKSVPKQSNWI